MPKKLTSVLVSLFLFVFFFSGLRVAFADLQINEILYSPASKQWVEVYNNSDTDIDVTQYKILDAGAAKDGHSISAISGGSNILPAHQYGVVAKDTTSVSTPYLFHASLGISTTASDTVILKNGANVIDSATVSPDSASNGDSLQLINGTWVSATPTPGAQNETASSTSSNTTTGGGLPANNENEVSPGAAKTTSQNNTAPVLSSKINLQITTKTLSFVGVPISLDATALQYGGEKLYSGKYFWNFGDGDSKEVSVADSQSFTHTYYYPGTYTVSLDYFQSCCSDVPDASSKVAITIAPADISISNVGDEKDFFITIENNTDYDADLSNWILASADKSFTIPRDTVISSKDTLTISPKITGFTPADATTLKLLDPEGDTVFEYGTPTPQAVSDATSVAEVSPTQTSQTSSTPKKSTLADDEFPAVSENSPATNQEATVISADAADTTKNNSNTKNILITAIFFIGVAAYAVYFIRRKKTTPVSGDEFDILDD